jgi:flagellar assembly protein FliH
VPSSSDQFEDLPTIHAKEFIPVNMNQPIQKQEREAKEIYDQHLAQQMRLDEPELANLRSEARSVGYEEGFRQGETKAMLQAREKLDQILETLQNTISELESFKIQLLTESQQSFLEIAQAVSETLVRRELRIDPSAFGDIIHRTVQQYVGSQDYTVVVHPEILDGLKTLADDQLSKKLKADDSLAIGDFRIESQSGVVDGDLKSMISEMIDKLDLHFNKEQDIAS